HAADQRERHRHAEIAEEQEAERHHREDDRRAHRSIPRLVSPKPLGMLGSSSSTGWSKPLRQPLTICSMVNSTTSAPQIGIAAQSEAIGVFEGSRKLPKPRR